MSFYVWFISLSIVSSRFIHVVAYIRIVFLRGNSNPLYGYIPHFINSFVDGPLSCFYLWAVVKVAAMNIGRQVSEFLFSILWGINPKVKLLDHTYFCLTF